MITKQPPVARWRGLFIGLFFWVYLSFMSAFLFDSPQAAESVAANSLAWSIWTYPLVHLLAIVLSRLAAAKSRDARSVRRLARLWWVNIAWFAGSFAWIMLVCGGDLGCA